MKQTSPPTLQNPFEQKTASRSEIVDEYGKLDSEVTLFQPKAKRHEALRKQIQAWHAADDAQKSYTDEGEKFTVLVSEKANQRWIIDIKALAKRLKDIFWLKASIPLEAVDEHLPAADHAKFIAEERTGRRTVKVVAKT